MRVRRRERRARWRSRTHVTWVCVEGLVGGRALFVFCSREAVPGGVAIHLTFTHPSPWRRRLEVEGACGEGWDARWQRRPLWAARLLEGGACPNGSGRIH